MGRRQPPSSAYDDLNRNFPKDDLGNGLGRKCGRFLSRRAEKPQRNQLRSRATQSEIAVPRKVLLPMSHWHDSRVPHRSWTAAVKFRRAEGPLSNPRNPT